MFKVHYVASEGERKASEGNSAQGFKSGFKLGLKITRRASKMTTKEVRHPYNPRTLSDVIPATKGTLTITCTKYGELIRVDDRGDHFFFTVQDNRGGGSLYSGKFGKSSPASVGLTDILTDILGEVVTIKWKEGKRNG